MRILVASQLREGDNEVGFHADDGESSTMGEAHRGVSAGLRNIEVGDELAGAQPRGHFCLGYVQNR
jgi:hypothetical protein